ncbi:Tetratricopeptide repeat protein 31 [Merluccius polli]|uniref:Tetratricopeptide repeat protein 31 n=1 Tax=Merluccius polli TaxID=89951 RepID=A0AA47P5X4_MERPO|nr:Tetratricopeptide repeat protein 31 [Merluccius polli]
MDPTGYVQVDPHIMSAIVDLVGRRRVPPRLLELGLLGGLDFDSSVFEDYDREVMYRCWPEQNYSPASDNNSFTRSSLYLPHHIKPKETKEPPKPKLQCAPTEPVETRQKERKRLEKLKKEKQRPKKNAEENEETRETKQNDKANLSPLNSSGGADGQSSSCDSDSSSCSDDSDESAESESESEELDLASSFVNKAALIVKRKLEQKEPKHKPDRKEEKKAPVTQEPEPEPTKNKPNVKPVQELPVTRQATVTKDMLAAPININPTYEDNVKTSKELATLGNQYASAGRFDMAVKYFTDAIKYNPKEFKLFGNRSFCFEKMQQYEKALTDAQLSLNMAPGWVKGLYRKGRALAGLKRYEEAASTFKDVLKLDSSCTEAAQELMRVQITQLMECGFTREQSSNALIIHGNLNKAMEVLSKLNPTHTGTLYKVPILPPAVRENSPRTTAVSSGAPRAHLPPAFQHQHDPVPNGKPLNYNTSNVAPKAAPPPPHGHTVKSNPEHPKPAPELFPIWVGNLLPSMTETVIYDLFSRVGRIHSIKVLISKRCAFVNFTTQVHCDHAIHRFHGYELMGNKLALRYPDRIPQGMGMSKAALKAEDLQDDLFR